MLKEITAKQLHEMPEGTIFKTMQTGEYYQKGESFYLIDEDEEDYDAADDPIIEAYGLIGDEKPFQIGGGPLYIPTGAALIDMYDDLSDMVRRVGVLIEAERAQEGGAA